MAKVGPLLVTARLESRRVMTRHPAAPAATIQDPDLLPQWVGGKEGVELPEVAEEPPDPDKVEAGRAVPEVGRHRSLPAQTHRLSLEACRITVSTRRLLAWL